MIVSYIKFNSGKSIIASYTSAIDLRSNFGILLPFVFLLYSLFQRHQFLTLIPQVSFWILDIFVAKILLNLNQIDLHLDSCFNQKWTTDLYKFLSIFDMFHNIFQVWKFVVTVEFLHLNIYFSKIYFQI